MFLFHCDKNQVTFHSFIWKFVKYFPSFAKAIKLKRFLKEINSKVSLNYVEFESKFRPCTTFTFPYFGTVSNYRSSFGTNLNELRRSIFPNYVQQGTNCSTRNEFFVPSKI